MAGKNIIYMDHAATTPLSPSALNAMMPYLTTEFGNASSLHPVGRRAKSVLDQARRQCAAGIGAQPSEIYFTGGGSESDNWALKMAADARRDRGRHIITTKIEHHAILHAGDFLEAHGYEVTYLDVDAEGFVAASDVAAAIRPDTILISVMTANNETGTIQPIREIGELAHEHGILFHTDAVQAYGHIPIDVDADHIDMLSASSHKINGPKGVGLLYIRNGVHLDSLIHGGQQERGIRGGTENIAGIVGFGRAAEDACTHMDTANERKSALQKRMIDGIRARIPYVTLNGPEAGKGRLANNINFRFKYVDGESLLLRLSEIGICCSAGSACDSGSVQPSHVLMALGIPYEDAFGSIRFTIDADTRAEDIDYVITQLTDIVADLRKWSPEFCELTEGE